MTSGTNSEWWAQRENGQEAVFRILNREDPVAALKTLVRALDPSEEEWPVTDAAIGVDSNVFLRLAAHRSSEDIIDYLVSKHEAPIILPGQAITEFWNNQMAAVETVADWLSKEYRRFAEKVQQIDEEFKGFSDSISEILENFQSEHGHVYSAATVHRTRVLLASLQERAIVPFVNRDRFQQLAEHRHLTKTPPGFEDARYGDFFIWADYLLGLSVVSLNGIEYRRTIFVTDEKKKDWVRNEVAHPILTAEAGAIGGVPFAIWSLDKLADRINSSA